MANTNSNTNSMFAAGHKNGKRVWERSIESTIFNIYFILVWALTKVDQSVIVGFPGFKAKKVDAQLITELYERKVVGAALLRLWTAVAVGEIVPETDEKLRNLVKSAVSDDNFRLTDAVPQLQPWPRRSGKALPEGTTMPTYQVAPAIGLSAFVIAFDGKQHREVVKTTDPKEAAKVIEANVQKNLKAYWPGFNAWNVAPMIAFGMAGFIKASAVLKAVNEFISNPVTTEDSGPDFLTDVPAF